MRTTRSKKAPAQAKDTPDDQPVESAILEPSSNNPPLLFILPDRASPDARIATLPNPATSAPSRYYFCPDKGLHEFTKVAAPKKTPRSCLIAPSRSNGDTAEEDSIVSKGYAVEDARLFIATPVDPLFMLLPTLIPAPDSQEQLFLSIDDHLDNLAENSKHLAQLLRSTKLKDTFEKRANAVCDNVDLGHEKMYRLSHNKLLAELVAKAHRMASKGLPASIESHFVQEALAMPLMAVPQLATTESQADATPIEEAQSTPSASASHSQPDQVSGDTPPTSFNQTSPSAPSTPENVMSLLRLRVSLDLIFSSYIPTSLHKPLRTLLSSSTSPLDFKPLDDHLEHIAARKKEAYALRSLSDNISRKRSGVVDEEAEEARAEKKRRKEEEDAKKKNSSRGVKQLSKVNTSGMQKLSSFFAKAPAKS